METAVLLESPSHSTNGAPDVPTVPELLTIAEFMRLARIGRSAAYNAVASGAVKSVRFGKSIRVPRSALAI